MPFLLKFEIKLYYKATYKRNDQNRAGKTIDSVNYRLILY